MSLQKPANRKWPWMMAVVAYLLAVGGWILARQGTEKVF